METRCQFFLSIQDETGKHCSTRGRRPPTLPSSAVSSAHVKAAALSRREEAPRGLLI